MNKGQLSLEFIIIISMAFATVFAFLFIMVGVSTQKTTEKTYVELNDLGIALQQEFIFASDLEDGYTRTIFVPDKVNALEYGITVGNTSDTFGFMIISFENQEIFYKIPFIHGTIQKGDNLFQKIDGELYLN